MAVALPTLFACLWSLSFITAWQSQSWIDSSMVQSSSNKKETPMTPAKKLIDSGKHKLTPFRKKVYEALIQVPEGKVTTYKELADKIGCRSSQAVGQALKNNPYAPIVPCHRVVSSTRSLGGFGGQRTGKKIDEKIELLKKEQVRIEEDETGAVVAEECIHKFN